MEHKLPKEAILWLFDNQRDIQSKSGLTVNEFIECMAGEIRDTSNIDSDDVPDPKELNHEDKNLMFDDLLLEKQNACEKYYARGRHSNVDCFYLSPNYFKLPRQTIRENANFICLFRQDLKNMNHLYSDHVSSEMKPEEFRDMCKKIWEGPHDFTVIDLMRDKDVGKYRKCFNKLYLPT